MVRITKADGSKYTADLIKVIHHRPDDLYAAVRFNDWHVGINTPLEYGDQVEFFENERDECVADMLEREKQRQWKIKRSKRLS